MKNKDEDIMTQLFMAGFFSIIFIDLTTREFPLSPFGLCRLPLEVKMSKIKAFMTSCNVYGFNVHPLILP